MDAESPKTTHAWTVLRTEDTTSYIQGKGAVRVRRVHWQLYDGSESYSDFALTGFDAAKVEKEIDKEAQKLAEVLLLKGPEITLGGA